MISISRRLWRVLPAVLVLGVGGCAGLFTKTPLPLYRLSAPTDFPANLRHVPVQLVISTPDAPQGLDTARIALSRARLSFDYLADGEWVDRAPAVVRAALIDGFENSKTVAGVGRESFSLRANFVIDGGLRDFEAVYDSPDPKTAGAPTAVVTLALELIKVPENTVVSQTLITARQPAEANMTPQIVAAFDMALASAVRQAVTWTVSNPALSAPRR